VPSQHPANAELFTITSITFKRTPPF
jgi:hypothetical protein